MNPKTKKCLHYVRTWYRGGTLEDWTELWRCDGCGIEGQLDTMPKETARNLEKKKLGIKLR